MANWRVAERTLLKLPAEPLPAFIAVDALRLMRARRGRWPSGDAAGWREIDDIVLTMEGLGQRLAYAWLVSPQGPAVTAAKALPAVRRNGRYWTQDEGLALFLTVDRLVPGWQAAAFAPTPALAEDLLARAAGQDRGAFSPAGRSGRGAGLRVLPHSFSSR